MWENFGRQNFPTKKFWSLNFCLISYFSKFEEIDKTLMQQMAVRIIRVTLEKHAFKINSTKKRITIKLFKYQTYHSLWKFEFEKTCAYIINLQLQLQQVSYKERRQHCERLLLFGAYYQEENELYPTLTSKYLLSKHKLFSPTYLYRCTTFSLPNFFEVFLP